MAKIQIFFYIFARSFSRKWSRFRSFFYIFQRSWHDRAISSYISAILKTNQINKRVGLQNATASSMDSGQATWGALTWSLSSYCPSRVPTASVRSLCASSLLLITTHTNIDSALCSSEIRDDANISHPWKRNVEHMNGKSMLITSSSRAWKKVTYLLMSSTACLRRCIWSSRMCINVALAWKKSRYSKKQAEAESLILVLQN